MKISRWPIYPVLCYAGLLLVLLGFSRLLLILWQYNRVATFDHALTVLAYGVRFDIIVICILGFAPALMLLMLSRLRLVNALLIFCSQIWLTLTTLLVVFLELNTPAFIDQYDTRPNRIYFEYLATPVEVINTALAEYPWHFAMAAILMTALLGYLLGFNRRVYSVLESWPPLIRLVMVPVIFLLCVIGIRSSFDHRPANPSTAAFTNDQLVNKLGLNSIYSVVYAYYSLGNEASADSIYGAMPVDVMLARVRSGMLLGDDQFTRGANLTWHRQFSRRLPNDANLVIILEESLGAGFVGKLGGIGVTPELDKLSGQGLWFTRLYATGTRSARGIEAIITGFPPSPSRSVLKLGLAQQRFSTLASLLKQRNYQTQFIYGGESHFDNMAGFFLANGFDSVIDQRDYPEAKFRATWGVSDEDLFERLDQQLQQVTGRPKFILAFSSSNHAPFEFPDNTISLYDAEKQTVNNAVKYADYALGKFFAQAKNQPYWGNTYFLIVADHDTRVFGAELVPVKKFHIPGLLIGPDVAPEEYTRVASQIDLAPTLLEYLGISLEHPMIGHSLLSLPKSFPGRAIMQYGNNHAYMEGDKVAIQAPGKPGKLMVFKRGKLTEIAPDPKFLEIGRAHALWSSYAYREGKFLVD